MEENPILLTLTKVKKARIIFFRAKMPYNNPPCTKNFSKRGGKRTNSLTQDLGFRCLTWCRWTDPTCLYPRACTTEERSIKVLHIDDDDDDDDDDYDDASSEVLHIGGDNEDEYDGDDYNSTCVTEET